MIKSFRLLTKQIISSWVLRWRWHGDCPISPISERRPNRRKIEKTFKSTVNTTIAQKRWRPMTIAHIFYIMIANIITIIALVWTTKTIWLKNQSNSKAMRLRTGIMPNGTLSLTKALTNSGIEFIQCYWNVEHLRHGQRRNRTKCIDMWNTIDELDSVYTRQSQNI